MVLHGRLHVQHVDHDGHNPHHTLVHRSGRPGRPTALGAASNNEAVHFDLPPLRPGTESGDGIHGAHGGFGHRQPSRPLRVAGAKKLVPGVGDERVLLASLLFASEHQRLVGHHLQFGQHRFGRNGDLGQGVIGALGRVAAVGTAADEEQRFRAGYGVGSDNGQPMLPERPVHLIGGEPGLRGHLQHVGGAVLGLIRGDEAVGVVRVGRGHVLVKGREFVLDRRGFGRGFGFRRRPLVGGRAASQSQAEESEAECAVPSGNEPFDAGVNHIVVNASSLDCKRLPEGYCILAPGQSLIRAFVP